MVRAKTGSGDLKRVMNSRANGIILAMQIRNCPLGRFRSPCPSVHLPVRTAPFDLGPLRLFQAPENIEAMRDALAIAFCAVGAVFL